MKSLCLAALMALGLVLSPGCGYQIGRPFDDSVDSVAVETMARGPDVFRREIEFRATEAIKKRIEHQTPYVLTSPGKADTLLVTRLELVTQSPLTYNPDTGVPRQQEVGLKVSMTWTDQRSGRVKVQRDSILVSGMYLVPEPFNQGFFVGREEALNELARRIVEEMEDNQWTSPREESQESSSQARAPEAIPG